MLKENERRESTSKKKDIIIETFEETIKEQERKIQLAEKSKEHLN